MKNIFIKLCIVLFAPMVSLAQDWDTFGNNGTMIGTLTRTRLQRWPEGLGRVCNPAQT